MPYLITATVGAVQDNGETLATPRLGKTPYDRKFRENAGMSVALLKLRKGADDTCGPSWLLARGRHLTISWYKFSSSYIGQRKNDGAKLLRLIESTGPKEELCNQEHERREEPYYVKQTSVSSAL